MRTLALLAAGLLIVCSVLGHADELARLGSQLTYFYLNPSPDSFIELQRNAGEHSDVIEAAGDTATLNTAVIVARISQMYGWPIQDGPIGGVATEILEGRSELAKYVVDDTLVDPGKLDIWWASFFATGEDQYLQKIYDQTAEPASKGDTGKLLVVGAAQWSFKANCSQHKRVLEFAKKKLLTDTVSAKQVELLKECISNAESSAA